MKRNKSGEYQFKLLDRMHFFSQSNPYKSSLNQFPDLLVDAALLLGNDYCPRIENNGAGTVVLGSLPRITPLPPNATDEQKIQSQYEKGNRQRREDSMLHKLAVAPDKKQWLLQYGKNGKSEMPPEICNIYWKARRHMLHAPVLQLSPDTGDIFIVPLNKLPDGESDLAEFLEQRELVQLMNDKSLLKSIYHCDILPLERKPLDSYIVQSTSTEGTKPAQLFEVLDFEKDPINIQPKPCLVNWLRARGYDARFFDERESIEAIVMRCQSLDKQMRGPPLRPIIGQHDGFFSIKPRVAGNDLDNWVHDCYDFVQRMAPITDDVIDELLGPSRRDRPSMRRRVNKLIGGGFYDPKTIKCRNVETKSDGKECVLICCDCLSSTTKVIHNIYAVIEDKQNGKYLLEHSCCSCNNGSHFCSHSIGLLFLLAILQKRASSLTMFIECYRVNLQYIQGELMLIENYICFDRYRKFESHLF
jgi:hypothetical protein